MTPAPAAERARHSGLRIVGVAAVAACLLVAFHVPHVNGPWYWQWKWQRQNALRLFPPLAAALALVLAGLKIGGSGKVPSKTREAGIVASGTARTSADHAVTSAAKIADASTGRRAGARQWLAVALIALGAVAGEFVTSASRAGGFDARLIPAVVENADDMGYLTDAERLSTLPHPPSIRGILADYPQILPRLHSHPRNKPPGLLLIYWMLYRLLGQTSAARAGPALTAALSAAGIAATYFMVNEICRDRAAALSAAGFLALCPAMCAFFPMFDCVYPLVTSAAIGFGAVALRTGCRRYAMASAAVVAVGIFFAFQLLLVGLFLLAYAAAATMPRSRTATASPADSDSYGPPASPVPLARVVRQSAVGLLVLFALYGGLHIATGYDVAATFARCFHPLPHPTGHPNPARLRHLPETIPWDLEDFALGTGWIGILIAGYWWINRDRRSAPPVFFVMAALVIVAVAAAGLLQTETARVWMFMLPVVMLFVGEELAAWSPRCRTIVYVLLWTVAAVIIQNMQFVDVSN